MTEKKAKEKKVFQETREYTTKELADSGYFSKSKKADSRHQLVMRLIREGKLPARNIQTDGSPRYLISGMDANNYLTR